MATNTLGFFFSVTQISLERMDELFGVIDFSGLPDVGRAEKAEIEVEHYETQV